MAREVAKRTTVPMEEWNSWGAEAGAISSGCMSIMDISAPSVRAPFIAEARPAPAATVGAVLPPPWNHSLRALASGMSGSMESTVRPKVDRDTPLKSVARTPLTASTTGPLATMDGKSTVSSVASLFQTVRFTVLLLASKRVRSLLNSSPPSLFLLTVPSSPAVCTTPMTSKRVLPPIWAPRSSKETKAYVTTGAAISSLAGTASTVVSALK
mmetsp:Transcript_6549/g.11321  ORF Transcript_6549/g.11321 Transcript_6549/m.11321 type:complete len:212 (+) Transcript_6549:1082-1717(+)